MNYLQRLGITKLDAIVAIHPHASEIKKTETISDNLNDTYTTQNNNIPTNINNNDGKNVTVYITKTGAKYHSNGCQYLRKSKIATTLDSDINRGYTPYSKCNPPR